MYKNKKISFYFPCRNEAAHLADEVKRVPSFVDEIIIVSNRSTDNTVQVAQNLGLKVIVDDREKGGIGYGFAHMSGLNAATGDIIATADADGTYPIEKLAEIIDVMLDDSIDFVSCNRYPLVNKSGVSRVLQLGVWALNQEVRLLYSRQIKDILSGMWLVRSEIKNKLKLTEGDWNLSPQIKLNAARNKNVRFIEYHIELYHRMGRTKQQYLKTGLAHLFWIAKNRFVRTKE